MNWKSSAKEIGKGFINLGIAFIIFAIIQPFVKGEFSPKLFLVAIFMYLLLNTVGAVLIAIGGNDNEC